MKQMLGRFFRYPRRKGLELDVTKSKTMFTRRADWRRKKVTFKCNGEEIENVKEFSYLGCQIISYNGDAM